MIKKLRPFFCLILAVIMPFCFIACKSSKNGNSPSDGGSSIEQNGGEEDNGGDSGETEPETPPADDPETPPVVNYVIDDAEIDRILLASFDVCKDFIVDLNESNILKDNGYTSVEGTKTYSIFDYAFYPARFAQGYGNQFDSTKTYARLVNTTMKYFEVGKNDTNDKVYVSIMIDTVDILTAYFYEFSISNGDIDSLKISYIYAEETRIDFSETLLDFKNSVCEIGLGNVSDFSNSRTFLTNKFTSEQFAKISSDKWGYSYYQKFDFSNNKSYKVNKSKMPENEDLINQFEKFGFISAFEKLDSYNLLTPSDFTDIGNDYFLAYSTQGFMTFDGVNCVFNIETGEEE